MTDSLLTLYGQVKEIPVADAAIAARAGIDVKTLKNTIGGTRKTNNATKRVLGEALAFFLTSDIPMTNFDALETAASISSAKAELEILRDTAFEDAALEMQPSSLDRFANHLRVNGRRNVNGHKQWREYVLIAGAPLEITEDGTEPITPARALELLGAL